MTEDFTQLNLHEHLMQALDEIGFSKPTPIQAAVIPVMLAGHDTIGQAQTGTGKTAAFALPILQNLDPQLKAVQCLIVAPTRELAQQVSQAIYELGRYRGVRVLPIYGGQSYDRQIRRINKGVDIVVGTPGRLLDLIGKKKLDLSQVRTVVLDEADEMLSMGFIEDIQAILQETPSDRQTAFFSATIPPQIHRLAKDYMDDPQAITIKRKQRTAATVSQRYYLVNARDKLAALTRLLEVEPITSALIFARTRADTGELAHALSVRGFPAEALNGDLSQEAREQVLNRFREGKLSYLVATDVAARGLDIDDISHVFNFDLPDDLEGYVHRIGRTGRGGKTGIAISLVTPPQQGRLRRIESFIKHKIAKANLPTVGEIQAERDIQLRQKMEMWLEKEACQREEAIVAQLTEAGYDPLQIAAAALRLATTEEKQQPIAPISEVRFTSRRRREQSHHRSNSQRYNKRPRRPTRVSHEEGMVRLVLNAGKAQGLRPNDVVRTIASSAKIPGSTIGSIHIQYQQTLVDVPEKFLNKVLDRSGQYRIREHLLTIKQSR